MSSAVIAPRKAPRPMEPKKMAKNLPMVLKKASASKESALPEEESRVQKEHIIIRKNFSITEQSLKYPDII